MLMDIKGGSSAAISGGSGENTGFLNAPEKPMGELENFESVFNGESSPSGETNEPVEDAPEMDAPEGAQNEVVESALMGAEEELSPVEQDVQEFEGIAKKNVKPNEDDIDKKVAEMLDRGMKKYRDDPAALASVVARDSMIYRETAFPQTWANGEGEAAA